MSSYAGVHSRSYSLVGRKGASVTFTKLTTTYTAETNTSTVASSTISGVAVEDSKDKRVSPGGLTEARGLVVYFVPSTFGDEPEEGATCSWGGTSYTVTSVKSVAPDGTSIGSYVGLG